MLLVLPRGDALRESELICGVLARVPDCKTGAACSVSQRACGSDARRASGTRDGALVGVQPSVLQSGHRMPKESCTARSKIPCDVSFLWQLAAVGSEEAVETDAGTAGGTELLVRGFLLRAYM